MKKVLMILCLFLFLNVNVAFSEDVTLNNSNSKQDIVSLSETSVVETPATTIHKHREFINDTQIKWKLSIIPKLDPALLKDLDHTMNLFVNIEDGHKLVSSSIKLTVYLYDIVNDKVVEVVLSPSAFYKLIIDDRSINVSVEQPQTDYAFLLFKEISFNTEIEDESVNDQFCYDPKLTYEREDQHANIADPIPMEKSNMIMSDESTSFRDCISKEVKGDIKVLKTNTDGVKLSNVDFTFYSDHSGTWIPIMYGTTVNGELEFKNLPYGKYLLQETKSEDGYYIDDQLKTGVELILDDQSENHVLEYKAINHKPYIIINKTDEDRSTKLTATFELLDASMNILDTKTTDGNGMLIFENLNIHEDYYVREKQAQNGYILNTELIPVNIKLNEDYTFSPEYYTYDVINYQGSIELIKKDNQNNILKEAKFKITDQNKSVVFSGTTHNGMIRLSNLAPGEYTIEEIEAPKGYQLLEKNVTFEIPETFKGMFDPIQIEIINEQLPNVPIQPTNPMQTPKVVKTGKTQMSISYALIILASGSLCVLLHYLPKIKNDNVKGI